MGGMDISAAWSAAKKADGVETDEDGNETKGDTSANRIAGGINIAAHVAKGATGIIGTAEAGKESGGTLGEVGAVTSQIGSMIPGIGGVIAGAAGAIMSTVGAILTAAAKHIAADIEDQNKKTMALYNNHQADLAATVAAVQKEETDAISQLSGVKGGQDELKKILPDLQAQLAALQFQQASTLSTFQASLATLLLQNDELTTINQSWQQINQQVADYLSAGGDAATAQQYLSSQLQKMQKDAQNDLNTAQDTAVQDAITLNGLLAQKVQLEMSYNQQVFDVVNKDSIERRAGSIESGQQLAQITAQYNTQSVALQSQIDLTTQKVTLESTIFTIATNISDLHTQDNTLQIAGLQVQIDKYTALQSIVKGISQDANGIFSAAAGTFTALPTTIIVELNLAGYTLTATGSVAGKGTQTTSPAVTNNPNPNQHQGDPNHVYTYLERRARMSPR